MAKRLIYPQFSFSPFPLAPPALPAFGYYQPLSEPVPIGLADKLTRPTISGFQAQLELVSIDRWLEPLSEPVVKGKIALPIACLPFFTTNPFPLASPPPVPLTWFTAEAHPMWVAARAQYFEAFFWSESAQFAPVPTVGNWWQSWRDPVRVLPRAPDLPAAPYFETQTFLENVVESEWHEPWSTPVWPKLGLGAQYHVGHIGLDTIVRTVVPPIGWFLPLSEPIRLLPRNPAIPFRPDFANTTGSTSLPETTTIGEWGQPQSRPVWQKPGLIAAAHQYLSRSDIFPVPLNPKTIVNANMVEAYDTMLMSGTISGAVPPPPTGLPVTATVAIVQTRSH